MLSPASTRGRSSVAESLPVVRRVAERQLVELGPLQEQVEVVLPREADAAVHLQRRRHHPLRRVGAPDLRGRRGDRRVGVVGADAPCRPVDARAHPLDVDEHVGAAVLHGLEAPDRAAELDPLLRVLDRHLERPGPRRRASRPRRTSRPGRASAATASRPAEAARRACRRSGASPARGCGPSPARAARRSRVEVDRGRARGRRRPSPRRPRRRRTARTGPGRAARGASTPTRPARHGPRRPRRLHATHAELARRGARPRRRRGRRRAGRRAASTVGANGAGAAWRPDLLEQHGDLDRAEPEAAERLRHGHAGPALLDHRGPQRGVASRRRRSMTARDPGRATRGRRAGRRAPSRSASWSSLRSKSMRPVWQATTHGVFESVRRDRPRRGVGARTSTPAVEEPCGDRREARVPAHGDTEIELPVVRGTENELGVDISKLRAADRAGHPRLRLREHRGRASRRSRSSTVTTASCATAATRSRQLADPEHSPSFLETAYLLIYGELPTAAERDEFSRPIRKHTLLHEDVKRFFDGFPQDAHPMGATRRRWSARSSTFYPDSADPHDPDQVQLGDRAADGEAARRSRRTRTRSRSASRSSTRTTSSTSSRTS